MSTESRARGGEDHRITPLELFFDLAMVFAFTQVTRLLADDPSWDGVLCGMLVLAALWWAWNGYAWLSSATDVDEGSIRLAMLASTGTMLVVGVAEPDAFGDDAVLSGSPIWSSVCCISFFLHSSLATIRTAAEHFCGSLRPRSSVPRCSWSRASSRPDASRFVALAIDYLGPVVIGIGRGWGVSAEHFAERFGLIVLIALGESIIAIGFGAGSDLDGSEACQAGRRPQTWSDESTLSRPPLSMEPRSGPTTRSPTFDARSILMA